MPITPFSESFGVLPERESERDAFRRFISSRNALHLFCTISSVSGEAVAFGSFDSFLTTRSDSDFCGANVFSDGFSEGEACGGVSSFCGDGFSFDGADGAWGAGGEIGRGVADGVARSSG